MGCRRGGPGDSDRCRASALFKAARRDHPVIFMKTVFLFLLAIFLATPFAATLSAESAASIAGIVKDPQGQPVAGATLTIYSRTGAGESTTTSDASGAYHFEVLPEGDYLLRVSALGFSLFLADDIHLARAAVTRDVPLQIDAVHEQVVVTASSTPQIPEHVSKSTTVIDQAEVDDRDASSLSDIVALAPGMRSEQLGGPG